MKTVIGVFGERDNAQFAIECLRNAGYKLKEMSIVLKKSPPQEEQQEEEAHITIGSAAITGLTTGLVVGALAGLLIGIGAIVIPNIGWLLISGPIAKTFGLNGTLAATVSGSIIGAIAGGILGMLMSIRFGKQESEEQKVQEEALLLAIPVVDAQEENVKNILAEHEVADSNAVTIPLQKTEYPAQQGQPLPQVYSSEVSPVGVKGGKREHTTNHLREVHHVGEVHQPHIPIYKPNIDIQ